MEDCHVTVGGLGLLVIVGDLCLEHGRERGRQNCGRVYEREARGRRRRGGGCGGWCWAARWHVVGMRRHCGGGWGVVGGLASRKAKVWLCQLALQSKFQGRAGRD